MKELHRQSRATLSADQIAGAFHGASPAPMIVLLVGVPASGKSSLVKSFELLGWTRLSKDRIRFELYGDEAARRDEALVERLFVEELMAALLAGANIIVDTTNVFSEHRQVVWRLAREHNYKGRYLIHFALPLHLCLKRNALRSRVVNPEVIRMFHDQLHHRGGYPQASEGELLRLRPRQLGQYRVLFSVGTSC
jgi:predicted kinase